MPKLDRKSQEEIYKDFLTKHGVCLECGEIFSHHLDEPFASCGCCTAEWHDFTPYQKLQYELEKAKNDVRKQTLQNLLDATCPASGPMIKDEAARKSIQEEIYRI